MIITSEDTIKIPKNVVVCPICGEQVIIEIQEITEDYDKTWRASEYGFTSSCISEPDITDEHYEDWLNQHFVMPYVDWLPVDKKIIDWLDKNYRFNWATKNV